MGHEGPTPPHGAGPTSAAPGHGVAALAHLWRSPFVYLFPRNPKTRGAIEKIPPPPQGGNHRERKALRQGEICRGNSFPEGGNHRHRQHHHAGLHRIIITIISTVVTIISTVPPRSAVTSRVILCVVHRGNFPGVDYYLWLMLLSFIGELKYMSRLLFIIISPLIMIHMMSCE